MTGLDPELAGMPSRMIAIAREMTGGGQAGVDLLHSFRDAELTVGQCRSVQCRVRCGESIDEAIVAVARQAPPVYLVGDSE